MFYHTVDQNGMGERCVYLVANTALSCIAMRRKHGHIPGTFNSLDSKAGRKANVDIAPSKKLRWADKVEKAAMKSHRMDTGIWTDETRRGLIANLARECW